MKHDSPQSQKIFRDMHKEVYGDEPTQLDRIEAKLDKLLAPKKRKPQQSRVEYPEWFEAMWVEYPKRAGSNPKRAAYQAVKARLAEIAYSDPHVQEARYKMDIGVRNYAAFCKATGKVNTELVMQAQRFFGPSQEYLSDWSIPKPKEKNGQPEIFSQSHQDADFSGQAEKELDPVDPYAELKS